MIRTRRLLVRVGRAFGAVALVAAAGALVFVAVPPPDSLLESRPAPVVRVLDREGGLLRELRSRSDGRAMALEGEIPPQVRDAFIAAEDARFLSHPGIDPLAIARAALQNLRAGRIVSGASTIPQQLARRLVPRERTLPGKLLEALWAVRLTAHHSKEELLRAYLDRVPLGHATVGIEAASRFYFGRPAAKLSTGQAALLAGMAASPTRFDPLRRPQAARDRMHRVLARMAALGMLDVDEAKRAGEVPLDLVTPERAFRAPHFVEALVPRLESGALSRAVEVRTTIDPRIQREVERGIAEELAALRGARVTQAAVIVIDNATGEVLAWVGSADFLDESRGGQNDGVRARRQPGSALKPFAYGLALASGRTPATLLADLDAQFDTPSGSWQPRNYDRRQHGPVRLRSALANSYNVPAVRIAEQLGPERLLNLLRDAGFDSLDGDADHYGVGLVLGNGEVTLRELARAFRGLALGGRLAPLVEVLEAKAADGTRLKPEPELTPRRFLPAPEVALLTDILADEGARVPAFGHDNALRLPFPVAAKTGTSRAHIDNWTVGYTRERTVAVWVGNFDGRPMLGVSGITGAAPIFRRSMLAAMEGITPAPLVDRSAFVSAKLCTLSGRLASPHCPAALDEVFLPGTEPQEPCPMHGPRGVDVGPQFYAWARAEGLDPVAPSGRGGLRLLSPRDGEEFLLDPALPAEAQRIPVQVLAPSHDEELVLALDDGRELPLVAPYVTAIPAERGTHRVEVRSRFGGTAPVSARFVVR